MVKGGHVKTGISGISGIFMKNTTMDSLQKHHQGLSAETPPGTLSRNTTEASQSVTTEAILTVVLAILTVVLP